jgi:HK97 family phage portal protein
VTQLRAILGSPFAAAPGKPVDVQAWRDAYQGGRPDAGEEVTIPTALSVSAVWAAIRVRSDAIGSLPLKVYERLGDSREPANDYEAYSLLHDRPNPEMPARLCWALVSTHMNAWGNAYVGKERKNGQVVALWPIRPDRVTVRRLAGGGKSFIVTQPGSDPVEYPASDVIHFWQFSLDGIIGLSPVAVARESLGGMIAMDRYSNRFWSNSAVPRLIIKAKRRLLPEQKRALERAWNAAYRGTRQSHKVAVIEEDYDVDKISLPPADAQFLEQRKLSVQEVARWFRVPASLIEGERGGSSLQYSTAQMDDLHFAKHSIGPETSVIEQVLGADPDLFPDPARYYPEFLFDDLLRADTESRYRAYALATGGQPWMDWRDIRQKENMKTDGFTPPATQISPDGMKALMNGHAIG